MNAVVQVPVSLLLMLAVAFLANIAFRWFELKASIRREAHREEVSGHFDAARRRHESQLQETIDHQYQTIKMFGAALEMLKNPLIGVTDQSAKSSKPGREPWSDRPEDDDRCPGDWTYAPISWKDSSEG